jgi:hypothetical protein
MHRSLAYQKIKDLEILGVGMEENIADLRIKDDKLKEYIDEHVGKIQRQINQHDAKFVA